jgi:hypothetical protein
MTRPFTENPTSTRVSLSDVRVIMMIMRVFMKELLYQAVMRQAPVLECMLSGARGNLRLCPIMSGMKWHCFLRAPLQWRIPGTVKPPGVAVRGLGSMPNRVMRRSYSGPTGGKILLTCGHQDGRKDRCGSGLGLVLFRLVVHPLQPGEVGPVSGMGCMAP